MYKVFYAVRCVILKWEEIKMYIKSIKTEIINNVDFMNILKYSHYNPTQEKLEKITKAYSKNSNVHPFGAFENNQLIGFIVIKDMNEQHKDYEIIDISVQKQHRKLGVASKLIDYVIKNFDMVSLSAETDEEAVGFYKKYGFSVKLAHVIENVNRYRCEYKLKSKNL